MGIHKRIKQILQSFIRIKKLNRQGCSISSGALIDRHTNFEGSNAIGFGSTVLKSDLGFATYIGNDCTLIKIQIGKYSAIANSVRIVVGNHPTRKFVSTYPSFYSNSHGMINFSNQNNTFDEYSYSDNNKKYYSKIGNDVWIGENVSILNGVHVGDGSVIATGAVVTKDVPPYSIIGGVPAKIIRYRFSELEISKLLEIKWWDKGSQWIEKYHSDFEDINDFLIKHS